jgi:Signal transduction histidine kinase
MNNMDTAPPKKQQTTNSVYLTKNHTIFFPIRSFTIATSITILTFGLLVWYLLISYQHTTVVQKHYFRLSELKGKIAQYDETLTMSAFMAAATGNLEWETRYNNFDKQLSRVIQETYVISSRFNLTKATAKTDSANQQLVAMERRSFAAVKLGDPEKAMAILTSPEYKAEKKLYSEGIEEVTTSAGNYLQHEISAYHRLTIIAILIVIIALPCIVAAWLIVFKKVRKYNRDRLRNEELIKESEAMLSELDANKNKFFSIIAHDLKSPFNSILGFSKHLAQNYRDIDEDKLGNYLSGLATLSQQTYTLLENLLLWARTQMGGIRAIPETINLKLVVEENMELFNGISASKNITITNQITKETQVYADPNMTTTIIRNLFANALKFTLPEGSIEIFGNTKGEFTEITINDTGIGISVDEIDNLFRLDARLKTQKSSNEKGTGLGLLLCKEFIEKNGGEIWVASTPGKGSSFMFTLPAHDNKPSQNI